MCSCEKSVEDGYRIDYKESPTAQLIISTIGDSTGAVNDTVSFLIQAQSDVDIKSIVVTSTISGSGGSGFTVPEGGTDPLIDHSFGTIQENTKGFNLIYNYIITQDTADPVVTFRLIDKSGQKETTQTIVTLPSIVRYNNVDLYTQSASATDGFSTLDSSRYRNLSNYITESTVNNLVQQSIDIIFLVSDGTAYLVAPYDGKFSTSETFIKNKTRFKLLTDISSEEFDAINSARLSAITKSDSIKQNGSTNVPVQVGSIVGFFTDYNSTNSYKAGILRVTAIHPSYCSWYTTGTTYQMNMDVITQISK